MKITHIMRAQEWIPSAPLHAILYGCIWMGNPYILPPTDGDGQRWSKLSKRHGSTAVREFREKGYLSEALLNYVSLVGWSYDGQREISKDELCKLFH